MILLFAAPPAAFADELPADAQAILDESGVDITDAAGWSLSDLCDTLGSWLAEGFQPALHFAAQAAGYLLLAGLLGLLAGSPYSGYVEILAVLGFGSLSLSTVMQLDRTRRRHSAGLPHLLNHLCAGVQRPCGGGRAGFRGAGVQRHVLGYVGFSRVTHPKIAVAHHADILLLRRLRLPVGQPRH